MASKLKARNLGFKTVLNSLQGRAILFQDPFRLKNSKKEAIKQINAFEQKLANKLYQRHVSISLKQKLNKDLLDV